MIGRHLRSPKMSWSMTVIGVAPPGLDYPRGVEFWVASEYGSLDVVGRLAANVTPEAARKEFQTFLAHDPDELRFISANTLGAQVHTLTELVTGDARPALLALTAAVALLLVLACTNVGNLLLLRAAGRARRWRFVARSARRPPTWRGSCSPRARCSPSQVVSLGVGLARALLVGLVRLAPAGLPRTDLITLAGTPVFAGVVVTGLTLLLFGVAPLFASLRSDLSSPLRSDARSGTEGRQLRKVRQTLVASQMALALVVLAGAGLLLRSLQRLTSLDMGYATEHVTMLNFSLPWRQYSVDCEPKGGPRTAVDTVTWSRCAATTNFVAHERVMASLRAVPGVESVSPEAVPPFLGPNVWMGRFAASEQSDVESRTNPWFAFDAVGPGISAHSACLSSTAAHSPTLIGRTHPASR